MKKYFLLIIMLLVFPMVVNASSISNITMDINIDKAGNAIVTETWNSNVTNGTEGWHPYYNIGNSTIGMISANMDGKEFSILDDWNENSSFSDKGYKAGLYYVNNEETDVCFGITEYGTHKYEFKYSITNFVSEIKDGDMIYWNLFPKNFSAEPDNVSITIHSDFDYKDIAIYGYGKGGAYNTLKDGKIKITSEGSVSNDEYLTVLVKFPDETFESSNILDNNFEYYKNMADEGSVNYESNNKVSVVDTIKGIITTLFSFIPFIIAIVVIIGTSAKANKYNFGETGNKVKKDIMPFRDIPCNKDIFRAYWVARNYNISKKKEDFLGTLLLKWLCSGNVVVEKIEKKGVFKTNTLNNIIFKNEPDSNEYEKKMYNWMIDASKDGKLESGEFTSWCKSHYNDILKWFDDIVEYESKMLVNENKAFVETKTTMKVFKSDVYKIDSSMMTEAEQLAGLKKFLKEFSMIQTREPIEVNLWKEYLMYAQIFGMADEVAGQFKKLYPDVIQSMDNMGYDLNDIIFLNMISNSGISSAHSASNAASSSYSSFGGGGGSFGSGGGGGGFR